MDKLNVPILLISEHGLYDYTKVFEEKIRESGYQDCQVLHVFNFGHAGGAVVICPQEMYAIRLTQRHNAATTSDAQFTALRTAAGALPVAEATPRNSAQLHRPATVRTGLAADVPPYKARPLCDRRCALAPLPACLPAAQQAGSPAPWQAGLRENMGTKHNCAPMPACGGTSPTRPTARRAA